MLFSDLPDEILYTIVLYTFNRSKVEMRPLVLQSWIRNIYLIHPRIRTILTRDKIANLLDFNTWDDFYYTYCMTRNLGFYRNEQNSMYVVRDRSGPYNTFLYKDVLGILYNDDDRTWSIANAGYRYCSLQSIVSPENYMSTEAERYRILLGLYDMYFTRDSNLALDNELVALYISGKLKFDTEWLIYHIAYICNLRKRNISLLYDSHGSVKNIFAQQGWAGGIRPHMTSILSIRGYLPQSGVFMYRYNYDGDRIDDDAPEDFEESEFLLEMILAHQRGQDSNGEEEEEEEYDNRDGYEYGDFY